MTDNLLLKKTVNTAESTPHTARNNFSRLLSRVYSQWKQQLYASSCHVPSIGIEKERARVGQTMEQEERIRLQGMNPTFTTWWPGSRTPQGTTISTRQRSCVPFRKSFQGHYVILRDVPHTQHRFHHWSPHWSRCKATEGVYITSLYDRWYMVSTLGYRENWRRKKNTVQIWLACLSRHDCKSRAN